MLWIAKFDEAFIVKAFDLRAVEAGFNQFAGRYAGGALDGFSKAFCRWALAGSGAMFWVPCQCSSCFCCDGRPRRNAGGRAVNRHSPKGC